MIHQNSSLKKLGKTLKIQEILKTELNHEEVLGETGNVEKHDRMDFVKKKKQRNMYSFSICQFK